MIIKDEQAERWFQYIALIVYIVATVALGFLAFGFIALAIGEVLRQAFAGEAVISSMLDAVGLVIIALAVFDVAKFLLEEELLRERELRSAREARRTLTKFITIVVIATSLESIVFIFESGKEDMTKLIYPTALLFVVVLLICGLGVYQWLSRPAERQDAAMAGRPMDKAL